MLPRFQRLCVSTQNFILKVTRGWVWVISPVATRLSCLSRCLLVPEASSHKVAPVTNGRGEWCPGVSAPHGEQQEQEAVRLMRVASDERVASSGSLVECLMGKRMSGSSREHVHWGHVTLGRASGRLAKLHLLQPPRSLVSQRGHVLVFPF